MKHLLGLFILLLFCLLKANGQDCSYSAFGVDYNINFTLKIGSPGYVFYSGFEIYMATCTSVECENNYNISICGLYNDFKNVVPLGIVNNRTLNYSKDGLKMTYISQNGRDNCQKYTTTVLYICDPSEGFYVTANNNLIGTCNIELSVRSYLACNKCPNCSTKHGTCNSQNGWCNCDGNTKGLNCGQLNAIISSVSSPTTSGGGVSISGDFSSIINISPNITISIGDLACNDVVFAKSKITCTIDPGQGFKQIKLSEIDGATLTYDGFYYRVPCSVDCSPFGTCNDKIGICVCDDTSTGTDCKTLNLKLESVTSTYVNGGQVYLNGDFSKVKNLILAIKIGDQQCSNVKFNDINFKILECTIGSGEGIKDIIISSSSLSFTKSNAFEYKYYTCPLDCSTPNGTCNKMNGVCTCHNEHFGNGCQFIKCPLDCSAPNGTCDGNTGICNCNNDHFGNGCQFIKCPLDCSTPNGICEGNTGVCTCDNDHFGSGCEFIKCPLDCSTPNGICNGNTGICSCDNEHFGDGCQYINCPLDCSTPNGTCDGNTGICSCENDHFGNGCESIKCPLSCSTPNGTCNSNTGICNCDDDHFGSGCEFIRCPLNCSTPNGNCNNGSGTCTCNSKYSGDSCEFIKCPLDCSTPNGICNNRTGICLCDNKYVGDGCDNTFIECIPDCSTTHGKCDNGNGNCKCDSQTKGLTCEESRLSIESVNSINSKGGTINIIGYFGTPTSSLTIKIGESQCTNIKVLNETTLTCEIGKGEGIHNITITDRDLSFTATNKFQYLDEKIKTSETSGGAIAGIVVGCVIGVSLIGAAVLYHYHKNKKVELFMK
ncbi:hypothetical protein ACTA71_008000 [Dictyostelium dimigraforme]